MNNPVSVLILTKNEEVNLPGCLASVKWSDDIHVYDSFSTDRTIEIAESFGAKVTRREFDDWSTHQNWGLRNIRFKYPWVLYLDADERATPELVDNIRDILARTTNEIAYRIEIRYFFFGRWLKHAQATPLFVRLFRPGKMHYERLVNPVPVVDGPIGKLDGVIDHFPFNKGISFWFERHNSYSTLEAAEILKKKNEGGNNFSFTKAFFARDFNERRMHQKQLFYRLPARPLLKFILLYVIKGGFLDGAPGFIYSVLQSIYEYMIVLKVRELSYQKADVAANAAMDIKG
jgi:glycosyltransferase involved in cell wall biosynthesis